MADEYFCPLCGRKMVHRKKGNFYGCTAYFPKSARNPEGYDAAAGEKQCKGSCKPKFQKKERKDTEAPDIVGSKQQKAIWHEFEQGKDGRHVICNSLPGTGKTTSIVKGSFELDLEREKVLATAFATMITDELKDRMPKDVAVFGLHALGRAAIVAKYGDGIAWKITLDKYKSMNILHPLLPEDIEEKDAWLYKVAVSRLVSLCKSRLLQPTDDVLDELCERYDVEVNGSGAEIFDYTRQVYKKSVAMKTVIDYDDMIFLALECSIPKYDIVIVDEFQDTTPAQQALILKAASEGE